MFPVKDFGQRSMWRALSWLCVAVAAVLTVVGVVKLASGGQGDGLMFLGGALVVVVFAMQGFKMLAQPKVFSMPAASLRHHTVMIGTTGQGMSVFGSLTDAEREELNAWAQKQVTASGVVDLARWPGWGDRLGVRRRDDAKLSVFVDGDLFKERGRD